MSETGFQNFNVFFSVAADLIYAVCLALFLRGFLAEQGHRLQKCAIVVCTYVFLSCFCGWIAAPQGTPLPLTVSYEGSPAGVLCPFFCPWLVPPGFAWKNEGR